MSAAKPREVAAILADFIKAVLILFMLIGIPITLYGAWKLYGSARETSAEPARDKTGATRFFQRFRKSRGESSSPDDDQRPRVHYVLSVRFLSILALGLGFLLVPLLIWHVAVPTLDTPAGLELTSQFEGEFSEILAWQVGPVTVRQMFIGFGAFMVAVFLVSVVGKILSR